MVRIRKKRIYLSFNLAIAVVLLITSSALSGCVKESNRYKEFHLLNGIAYCSFEYPASHEEPFVEAYSAPDETYLTTDFIPAETERPEISFGMHIYRGYEESPDAKAALEGSLQFYETNEDLRPDFKLLDRSPVMVAGVWGEQIVYSYSWFPYSYLGPKAKPITRIVREIYLDHQGVIWEIYARYDAEVSETAKTDFEHLLDTFQFLDRDSCQEYKTFTLEEKEEGKARFSFQYPACYENNTAYIYAGILYLETDYPDVSFTRYSPEESWTSWLLVYVYDPGSSMRDRPDWGDSTDIETVIEADISHLTTKHDSFQLLERSSISVDGIPAEQIICYYVYSELDFFHVGNVGTIEYPTPLVSRMTYFAYDGLIWKIWLASVEDTAEADKAVFEHILKTFKILD